MPLLYLTGPAHLIKELAARLRAHVVESCAPRPAEADVVAVLENEGLYHFALIALRPGERQVCVSFWMPCLRPRLFRGLTLHIVEERDGVGAAVRALRDEFVI